MQAWFKELFGVSKPVIAMCHFQALPGDRDYAEKKGVEWILESARADLHALQDGGVDAILVGESLLTSNDIRGKILELLGASAA
jgi:predicted TIM-barrel enzyme